MHNTLRLALILFLAIFGSAYAALAQDPTQLSKPSNQLEDFTTKLPLVPGLTVVYPVFGGTGTTGLLGDYDFIVKITSASPDSISFNWSMTHAGRYSGSRTVTAKDITSSHKVAEYFWDKERGVKAGVVSLRVSDEIFHDLKAGQKAAFELDGPDKCNTLEKVGEEDLVLLVDDHDVLAHTIRAKTEQGWTYWILDNPACPLILQSELTYRAAIPRFNYPNKAATYVLEHLRTEGQATTHAVLFAFNSAELRDESKPLLNAIGEYLQDNPAIRLEIQGHTDNIGGIEPNIQLSQRRADSVKVYLVQRAEIIPERLVTKGYGYLKPAMDNLTPEGRARNRRVVFRKLKG